MPVASTNIIRSIVVSEKTPAKQRSFKTKLHFLIDKLITHLVSANSLGCRGSFPTWNLLRYWCPKTVNDYPLTVVWNTSSRWHRSNVTNDCIFNVFVFVRCRTNAMIFSLWCQLSLHQVVCGTSLLNVDSTLTSSSPIQASSMLTRPFKVLQLAVWLLSILFKRSRRTKFKQHVIKMLDNFTRVGHWSHCILLTLWPVFRTSHNQMLQVDQLWRSYTTRADRLTMNYDQLFLFTLLPSRRASRFLTWSPKFRKSCKSTCAHAHQDPIWRWHHLIFNHGRLTHQTRLFCRSTSSRSRDELESSISSRHPTWRDPEFLTALENSSFRGALHIQDVLYSFPMIRMSALTVWYAFFQRRSLHLCCQIPLNFHLLRNLKNLVQVTQDSAKTCSGHH